MGSCDSGQDASALFSLSFHGLSPKGPASSVATAVEVTVTNEPSAMHCCSHITMSFLLFFG